tara:strand:- start:1113 stop:1514 length:402 start_codon:yes stop_codon:yes gene_type:complete
MAATLTGAAGASRVFRGSYVLYCDEEKARLLGVAPALIQEQGAVSEGCVLSLLQGLARDHGPCYAAAVSGIAGPDGARPGKPVGTVWIGLASPNDRYSKRFQFDGDREAVRRQAVEVGLQGLLRLVKEEEGPW